MGHKDKNPTEENEKFLLKPPLVFLHGWGTTSSIWQEQISHFSNKWQVIIPDYLLQDSHFSFFISLPRTIKSLSEALFTFCSHQHISSLHIIGWSLGSMIALEFTSRFSPMVSSLTLVDGTPKFLLDDSFPYGLSKGELRLLRKRLLKDKLIAFTAFHQLLFTEQEKNRKMMLKIRDRLKSNKDISDQALLEGLDILEKVDLRSILSDINLPVLILHGEDDHLCPVEAGRYMHKKIGGSQIKVFPDCGHLPFLTQPKVFNQALEDFLNSFEKSYTKSAL